MLPEGLMASEHSSPRLRDTAGFDFASVRNQDHRFVSFERLKPPRSAVSVAHGSGGLNPAPPALDGDFSTTGLRFRRAPIELPYRSDRLFRGEYQDWNGNKKAEPV